MRKIKATMRKLQEEEDRNKEDAPNLIFKPAICSRCEKRKICAEIPSVPPARLCLDCLTLGFGEAAKAFSRNPFRLGRG